MFTPLAELSAKVTLCAKCKGPRRPGNNCYCSDCQKEYDREYHATHYVKKRTGTHVCISGQTIKGNKSYCISCRDAYSKGHHANHIERYRDNQYRNLYNITLSDYNALYKVQGGLCAMCGKEETAKRSKAVGVRLLSVDHNHTTGKIRALICLNCNKTVGYYETHKDLLLGYLAKYGGH